MIDSCALATVWHAAKLPGVARELVPMATCFFFPFSFFLALATTLVLKVGESEKEDRQRERERREKRSEERGEERGESREVRLRDGERRGEKREERGERR